MEHEPVGRSCSEGDGHPVHFVHVVSRLDKRVLLPQKNALLGFHLEVDPDEIFDIRQGKHLPHHLENQGGFIKGEFLSHAFLG